MLTPEYLDDLPGVIVELYTLLDISIAKAIARRIARMGDVTESSQHQIDVLAESGLLYDEIIALIAEQLPVAESVLRETITSACVKTLEFDNRIYTAAGLKPLPFRQSKAMTRLLVAGLKKTNGVINNLTLTTANTTQTAYIQACDLAYMQVSTGAMDYITAIRQAVASASEQGARVLYPSGHSDHLDVAVRRAVLTGVSQTAGEISIINAHEAGWDLMEITAHIGARPSHAKWQGKIVSLSGAPGYLSLKDIGYKTGEGFKGWNCRHDWYPFFEGISKQLYDEERLKEWRDDSTYYDNTQRQRAMERDIRKTKRQLAATDEAIKATDNEKLKAGLKEDFERCSVKLKSQEAKMKDFCKEKGFLVQSERVQVQGFGRSQAQKAVQANKSIAKQANMLYDIGGTEKNIRAYFRDLPLRRKLQSEQTNISVLVGRQSKHFKGSNNYRNLHKNIVNSGHYGPSIVTISQDEIEQLVKEYRGTGILIRNSKGEWTRNEIIVNNNRIIGIDVDYDTGAETPTSVFTIRYADNGVHIVPHDMKMKGGKSTK